MGRTQRLATRRPSRSGDFTRLASMLMMLVVLAMTIRYAADPSNWQWVENLDPEGWGSADDPVTPSALAAAAKPDAPKAAAAKSAPAKVLPEEPQPAAQQAEMAGPTDEDPEEFDSAREEFQAVGDRTLFLQPEEMLAYNRLVQWTRNQTFEAMLKRAKGKVVFNDFVQSPNKWRGKLVALDLTACRVLKYEDKPDDNPLYENLHEVWGFTSESRNWVYEAVVVDPPKELPTGPSVLEKVRVVGYFFKVQAYQPAGAKVNQPPLYAPIFIGRLAWTQPVVPRAQSADYLWAGLVAALFGLIMIAAVGTLFLRRRRPSTVQSFGVGTSGLTTDEWLDRAVVGEAPLDDFDDVSGDRPSDGPAPQPIDPPDEDSPRAE